MEKSIRSPRHQVLATLLREVREAAGLSQSEVAALIDEPQSVVSKYEAGARRLDLVELEYVAKALGLTLSDLVKAYEARV